MRIERGERERVDRPRSISRRALGQVGHALMLAGGAFGALVLVLADPLELIASAIAAVVTDRRDRSGGTEAMGVNELTPPRSSRSAN